MDEEISLSHVQTKVIGNLNLTYQDTGHTFCGI